MRFLAGKPAGVPGTRILSKTDVYVGPVVGDRHECLSYNVSRSGRHNSGGKYDLDWVIVAEGLGRLFVRDYLTKVD